MPTRDPAGTADRHIVFKGQVPTQAGPDGMPSRHAVMPDRSGPFDPFIYFVHFGPRELHETSWGFPPHPHRGFETVTYMLAGELEHRDSQGAHAILGPGDVQWMTAGGGIVHAEEPPQEFQRRGGLVNGFQIWLNLPSDKKLTAPGFQMLRGADMPVETLPGGGSVRLIAGRLESGAESPVSTYSPVFIADLTLPAGTVWTAPLPGDWSLFAYDFDGPETGTLSVFDPEAAGTARSRLENTGNATRRILVLGGRPLRQPIAAYGPFVMETRDEIIQAIDDYNAGRMGTVPDRAPA